MSPSRVMAVSKHQWAFKPRFRAAAYGWKGSKLAIKRLKEAVSEIKRIARTEPVTAADGAIILFERFWPALEHIDTSSGALGNAVCWAQAELLPLIVAAPADRITRDGWLHRLFQAIQDDGVDYLSPIEDMWGELCGSPEIASNWADQLIEFVRSIWSDPQQTRFAHGATVCLSSLLAAGRYRELWDLLAILPYQSWHYRKFGFEALRREERVDEALAYAEACRGLNAPKQLIDQACERLLRESGRAEEAYQRYSIGANEATTGLATFRAIAKKYPQRDPESILTDLARHVGEAGRFFAAAKDAGYYDLALRFATEGRTDPKTLNRAARDFATKKPAFAKSVGRLALERLLQGFGYEVTYGDVIDAYRYYLAAAEKLGEKEAAAKDAENLAKAIDARTPMGWARFLLRDFMSGPPRD